MNITKEQFNAVKLRAENPVQNFETLEMECVFETIQRKIANGTITVID